MSVHCTAELKSLWVQFIKTPFSSHLFLVLLISVSFSASVESLSVSCWQNEKKKQQWCKCPPNKVFALANAKGTEREDSLWFGHWKKKRLLHLRVHVATIMQSDNCNWCMFYIVPFYLKGTQRALPHCLGLNQEPPDQTTFSTFSFLLLF